MTELAIALAVFVAGLVAYRLFRRESDIAVHPYEGEDAPGLEGEDTHSDPERRGG